jgi:undecaprenyl phosphate N,N'-diacetylbacillosamine 1-phosphate transferase
MKETIGPSRAGSIAKRAFDLGTSAALLAGLSPIFAAIAIAVLLDSGRPILFRQRRLGLGGREFLILKFRTMVVGAEAIGTGIRTHAGDPRVTRVGRFLRRTSLDELPQLLNVLRGEMSLVGPRPPVPYHPKHFADYSAEESVRFSMLPGMTGYAQTMGRNALHWDQRLLLDRDYVRNWSLWLDLQILWRTALLILPFTSSQTIPPPTMESRDD